ncbi:uncharacterized protein LOC144107780 [Amblyomma americanum]
MATYRSTHEPLLTCPFNPAHQMKRGRYLIHISKCKRSHRGEGMKRCPFSPDHEVEPHKIMHHIYTCPLNKAVNYTEPPSDKDVPVMKRILALDGSKCTEITENWDSELADRCELQASRTATAGQRQLRGDSEAREPGLQCPGTSSLQSATQSSHPEALLYQQGDRGLHCGARPRTPLDMHAAHRRFHQDRSEVPRQPTSEPKVIQSLKMKQHQALEGWGNHQSIGAMVTPGLASVPAAAPLSAAHGVVHSQFETPLASALWAEEEEACLRMRLLGIGRGRRLN